MAGQGRTGADELLAAELAAGKTITEAATAAGIGERTAFRRLTDRNFTARVTELRARMVAEASGRLSKNMSRASDVLVALLDSKDEGVQYKAAVKIVELGVKLVELTELELRITELERTMNSKGDSL